MLVETHTHDLDYLRPVRLHQHAKARSIPKSQVTLPENIKYRHSNTFANVTFFGAAEKDMPKILRVGDILRIQQVNCTEYKGQR